ncbi:MAG: alpha/beta fold hydrolase [Deltaproteobacteria bacterium]|nr:alpha/beta fold hydrolase [Deltaproteobacteria bacterium]
MKRVSAFAAGLLLLLIVVPVELKASPVGEVQALLPEMVIAGFTGLQGVEIVYGSREIAAEKGAVVIVNGRNETFVKYRQVISSLWAAGYSVYTFDHRGQGFSGRMLADPCKGYVESFADYVADLHFFLEKIVRRPPEHCLVLAHSMGGTIVLLHELRYPGSFTGIALAAPMLGFPTAPWPAFLVPPLLALLEGLGFAQSYIPGGGPFQPEPFNDNKLTSDRENYMRNQRILLDHPAARLGSPTNAWVGAALAAIREIMAGAPTLRTPLLVLQAGADRVVDNRATELFCQSVGICQRSVIAGSRHEILMESPQLRGAAAKEIFTFFTRVGEK